MKVASLEQMLAGGEAGARRRLVLGLLLCYVVGVQGAGTSEAAATATASGLLRVMLWNARRLQASKAGAKHSWIDDRFAVPRVRRRAVRAAARLAA